MELGPVVDSVRSLYLLSGELLDVGLLSTPVKRQPALHGTPTDAPHVPRLYQIVNAMPTTKIQSWTQYSDGKDGTLLWNAFLSNKMDTGYFAKPAIPKSPKPKGK